MAVAIARLQILAAVLHLILWPRIAGIAQNHRAKTI